MSVFCSVFGRNDNALICFRDLVTFSSGVNLHFIYLRNDHTDTYLLKNTGSISIQVRFEIRSISISI